MGFGIGQDFRGKHPLEDGRAHPLLLCECKNVIPYSVSGWLTAMRLILIERTSLPYRNAFGMREKGALLRLMQFRIGS